MDEQKEFIEEQETDISEVCPVESRGDPPDSQERQETLSRSTGVYELPVHGDSDGFSDGDLIKDAAADHSLMDDTREWDVVADSVRRASEPDAESAEEDGAGEGESKPDSGSEPEEGETGETPEDGDEPADGEDAPGGDAEQDESEAPQDDSPDKEADSDEAENEPEETQDGNEDEQTDEEVNVPDEEDAAGGEPADGEDAPEEADFLYLQIDRKPKKRRKKHPLVRLFLFVVIIVAAVVFLTSSLFDIKNIEVSGNRYFTDSEIISMADATKGGNIFRLAQRLSIKRRLLENPYFTGVKVKRKLPSTEVIEVKERRQVAAVPYGDQYVVIDTEGVVLRKSSVDPEVTLLKGMTISRMEVNKKIEVEESDVLKSTLRMLSSMRKGDFYFKQINVSKSHIEAYITDMLVVKGSPDKVEAAIKSGGLQKVVNKLFKKKIKRGTIDISRKNYISSSPEVQKESGRSAV